MYFIFNIHASIALVQEQNEGDDDDTLDEATVIILILTGIGALMLLIFMGCVATVYWAPRYAKFLEKQFGITNC